MNDLIPYIIGAVVALIGAVVALIGAGVLWLRRAMTRKRQPTQHPDPPAPPEPEKTAEEHTHAQHDETPDAVDAAAADHGVDPDLVADMLDAADAVRE